MAANVVAAGRSQAVSAALALAAFGVFAALPQRVFHGIDTDTYALFLQGSDLGRIDRHPAYLPLCHLVRELGGALDLGAVQAMWLASALGSAIAVWFVHRAAVRLLPDAAAWAAIGVAVTPACFYFATAAEVHGVFAAGSGASWWAFARWRDGRQLGQAVAVGAICGAAATLHAFGHLLSPTFVAIVALQRTSTLRELALHAVALAAAHVVAVFAIGMLLGRPAAAQSTSSVEMLGTWAGSMQPHALPATFVREVVLPYLPWSALALGASFVARARPWSLAYGVAVATHAPYMLLFLSRDVLEVREQGSYLLPTAVPAVLAAMAALRGPWRAVAVALAAGLSLVLVVPRWAPVYRREFVEAVARVRAERDVAFLVGVAELEGVRTELEGTFCVAALRGIDGYFGWPETSGPRPELPRWFDAMLVVVGGSREWIVTRDAQRDLQGFAEPSVHRLWREHVPATYEMQPFDRPGLEGAVLLHRR